MPAFMISFTQIPQVGFAHHFYMEQYLQNHLKTENSIELVYIKSGYITTVQPQLHHRSGQLLCSFPSAALPPYSSQSGATVTLQHSIICRFHDFTVG